MNKKLLTLVLFSFFISSCATTKLSDKDQADVDSGKKAILQTYNQPLLGSLILDEQPVTQVIAIDGKKIKSDIFNTDEKFALNTGTHSVEFRCVSRSGHDERDYSEVLQVKLKPFHEYLVRCSFDSGYGADGTYSGSFSIKEQKRQ